MIPVYFSHMRRTIAFVFVMFLVLGSPLSSLALVSTTSQSEMKESPFFSFVPPKIENKLFLVKYDNESMWDDLAYLATIPSALYYQDNSLYASPLIFWEEEQSDIYTNANQGIKYFLQDWLGFSPESKVICLNLDEFDLDCLKDEGLTPSLAINGKDAEEMANKIALSTWKANDFAVVANLPPKSEKFKGFKDSFEGSLSPSKIGNLNFKGTKEPTLATTYHNFTLPKGYKWIEVDMEWGGYKGQDPDLQLFDWNLGQVAVSENWNVRAGAFEHTSSYVRNLGKWGVGITYMPTEDLLNGLEPSSSSTAQEQFSLTCNYVLKITAYPGKEYSLPAIPYGCKNAEITLDGTPNLGLVIRDESKAVIWNEIPYKNSIKIDELGDGNYYACVVDCSGEGGKFELHLRWEERQSKELSQSLERLCNSAIFASLHNCPLLFTKNGKISSGTKDVIEKLGVETLYSADSIRTRGYDIKPIDFNEIRRASLSSDIVFSSAKPFSYTNKPISRADYTHPVNNTMTLEGSYFFAPAAYAAAFHGSNLILVENHFPQSAVWHRQNWINTRNSRDPPSVGDMIITGRDVYSCLDSHGLDRRGKERILTIAGEYQLGPTWDRMFVGKAIPGRIFGTPVDASYWFARNAFYPALIYSNPALDGVALINGSSSQRTREGQLEITKLGGEEVYQYPVLNTWVCYEHEFNKIASEYWGLRYSTTSGLTPYWSKTGNPIDEGISRKGRYLADMTCSETIPKYLERAGYSSCFSTNFRTTAENLNRGTLMWFEIMHGGHRDHGIVGSWSLSNEERNPWRAYEYQGSTANPDTLAMSKLTGLDVNPGADGVVICIWGQTPETDLVSGKDFDRRLDNIHSTGVVAGSCLIANTYMHLTMIRHGSSFQIIDPWTTSWYCAHAFNMISRSLALGEDIGSAYERAIGEVGISYLTGGWWWDICENIVYFGDPGLRIYVPEYSWEKPELERNGLHLI